MRFLMRPAGGVAGGFRLTGGVATRIGNVLALPAGPLTSLRLLPAEAAMAGLTLGVIVVVP
jgi:hypothetical protein